jgi:O-antigen/teichoic acid export membrane protein
MLNKLKQSGILTHRRSPFFRNTLKLFIGSGIAQAISVVLSPILTRLYSPDDFGLYTFYISIVAGFVLISSLRYELAIVFSEQEKDAASVFSLSVLLDFLISAALFLVILCYHLFFYSLFPVNPVLGKWLYALPVLVFCLGLGNILQNWLIRKKRFRTLSAGKIVNSVGNNGIMLILGIAGLGAWGLFTGYFAGSVIFLIFLIYVVFRSDRRVLGFADRFSLRSMAVKYKELPASNTPQAVFEMLQNYGIIYLVKIFFSSTIVGLYALSMRVLQAPLWLIGSAFLQVYMQDASDRYNKNEALENLLKKTIRMAFIAVLPVLVLMVFAGPWLFGVVFGQNWREAGVYARILAPWMFFDFIRFTISQTPLIIGKARAMFLISLAGNGLMIISLIIGGWVLKDIRAGFIILSFTMSLYAIGVILWIYRITIHKKDPDPAV